MIAAMHIALSLPLHKHRKAYTPLGQLPHGVTAQHSPATLVNTSLSQPPFSLECLTDITPLPFHSLFLTARRPYEAPVESLFSSQPPKRELMPRPAPKATAVASFFNRTRLPKRIPQKVYKKDLIGLARSTVRIRTTRWMSLRI